LNDASTLDTDPDESNILSLVVNPSNITNINNDFNFQAAVNTAIELTNLGILMAKISTSAAAISGDAN
jgi:hypothetical protein